MSAPWFILPGTCVVFSECRLFWAHTRRLFAIVQIRFETRPPWCMTPRTCCLSTPAHGVPVCPAGRIDRPDTLAEFLDSWCAGPTPFRTKDRRSVCTRTALPNHCWKRLPSQPSFSAPCLGSRLALAIRSPSNGMAPQWRPFEPELIDSLCHDADEVLIGDGKRVGSVTEPDNSFRIRSRHKKRLSSISPSLAPNEIMSLTAEGCWSCWVKRTGECSLLCSDGEARGH